MYWQCIGAVHWLGTRDLRIETKKNLFSATPSFSILSHRQKSQYVHVCSSIDNFIEWKGKNWRSGENAAGFFYGLLGILSKFG